MDFTSFIQDLLLAIITCAVPVITTYLIKLIEAKKNQINVKIVDDNIKDAFNTAVEIIEDCTEKTAQVYVDGLKKQNKFDEEAQKKALQMTIDSVKNLISQEGIYAIEKITGDFEQFLVTKIESTVRKNKSK